MKGTMQAKEAINRAKASIQELFYNERYTDWVSADAYLEEIDFDPDAGIWKVTISFFPDSKSPLHGMNQQNKSIFGIDARQWKNRLFKVVEIDDNDGNVLRVNNRTLPT